MKRLLISIITVVLLGGALVALSAPASAVPIYDECQTRTSSSWIDRPSNMIWMPDIAGGIFRWGHYRVSNCRTSVSWVPRGYAFNSEGVLEARLRIYNSRGHTLRVTGWVTAYGGGQAVRLAGMLVNNEEFSVEYRNVPLADRNDELHPIGTIRF